jgi:hypothetical protein
MYSQANLLSGIEALSLLQGNRNDRMRVLGRSKEGHQGRLDTRLSAHVSISFGERLVFCLISGTKTWYMEENQV